MPDKKEQTEIDRQAQALEVLKVEVQKAFKEQRQKAFPSAVTTEVDSNEDDTSPSLSSSSHPIPTNNGGISLILTAGNGGPKFKPEPDVDPNTGQLAPLITGASTSSSPSLGQPAVSLSPEQTKAHKEIDRIVDEATEYVQHIKSDFKEILTLIDECYKNELADKEKRELEEVRKRSKACLDYSRYAGSSRTDFQKNVFFESGKNKTDYGLKAIKDMADNLKQSINSGNKVSLEVLHASCKHLKKLSLKIREDKGRVNTLLRGQKKKLKLKTSSQTRASAQTASSSGRHNAPAYTLSGETEQLPISPSSTPEPSDSEHHGDNDGAGTTASSGSDEGASLVGAQTGLGAAGSFIDQPEPSDRSGDDTPFSDSNSRSGSGSSEETDHQEHPVVEPDLLAQGGAPANTGEDSQEQQDRLSGEDEQESSREGHQPLSSSSSENEQEEEQSEEEVQSDRISGTEGQPSANPDLIPSEEGYQTPYSSSNESEEEEVRSDESERSTGGPATQNGLPQGQPLQATSPAAPVTSSESQNSSSAPDSSASSDSDSRSGSGSSEETDHQEHPVVEPALLSTQGGNSVGTGEDSYVPEQEQPGNDNETSPDDDKTSQLSPSEGEEHSDEHGQGTSLPSGGDGVNSEADGEEENLEEEASTPSSKGQGSLPHDGPLSSDSSSPEVNQSAKITDRQDSGPASRTEHTSDPDDHTTSTGSDSDSGSEGGNGEETGHGLGGDSAPAEPPAVDPDFIPLDEDQQTPHLSGESEEEQSEEDDEETSSSDSDTSFGSEGNEETDYDSVSSEENSDAGGDRSTVGPTNQPESGNDRSGDTTTSFSDSGLSSNTDTHSGSAAQTRHLEVPLQATSPAASRGQPLHAPRHEVGDERFNQYRIAEALRGRAEGVVNVARTQGGLQVTASMVNHRTDDNACQLDNDLRAAITSARLMHTHSPLSQRHASRVMPKKNVQTYQVTIEKHGDTDSTRLTAAAQDAHGRSAHVPASAQVRLAMQALRVEGNTYVAIDPQGGSYEDQIKTAARAVLAAVQVGLLPIVPAQRLADVRDFYDKGPRPETKANWREIVEKLRPILRDFGADSRVQGYQDVLRTPALRTTNGGLFWQPENRHTNTQTSSSSGPSLLSTAVRTRGSAVGGERARMPPTPSSEHEQTVRSGYGSN